MVNVKPLTMFLLKKQSRICKESTILEMMIQPKPLPYYALLIAELIKTIGF